MAYGMQLEEMADGGKRRWGRMSVEALKEEKAETLKEKAETLKKEGVARKKGDTEIEMRKKEGEPLKM